MRCSRCGVCCTETEMLLSKNDIKRLVDRGYKQSKFVHYDKLGYATLKNRNGYCIFYDQIKHRCNEYENRPIGCRIYPVILDVEKGIVLDSICESRNTVTEKEKTLRGKRVIKLLEIIDSEAQKRR
jgi:Fe-S-cluster containining protein